MSAPALPSAQDGGYFSQTSTRWDIVKFVFPLLLGFALFAAALYYSNEAQGQEIERQRTELREFHTAKEERGARLLVLESQITKLSQDMGEIKTDLRETRADIKTLLARSASR